MPSLVNILAKSSNRALTFSRFSSNTQIILQFYCTARQCSSVRAKLYGVLYNRASSIAFDETSGYWSALKRSRFLGFSLVTTRESGFHWSAFRNHQGSTFTEKDRNKLNYRIGPLRSDSVIKLVSDLITESDQAVRAVHSCSSWFTSPSWQECY